MDIPAIGRRRGVLALLVALCMAVAACGDNGETSTSESGDRTTSTPSDASDRDPDGVLRLGYDLVAGARGGFTWDPSQVTTNLTDSALFYYVYGTFLRPTATGEIIPDLAESTTVVDATTIDISLREGVTFSDGSPFDATVVKAGLDRQVAQEGSPGFSTGFFDLESVEVVDPRTVRLSIPNGTAASWHDTYLSSWETSIVPAGFDAARPVGAGPMTVSAFSAESSATLTKRDDYWDADGINVARIELVHVASDGQAAVNALGAGQVDFARIDPSQVPALGAGKEALVVANPTRLMTLSLCKREGPLADPDVRRALNKAVDRELLSEAVFDGTYEVAHGLWPDGHRFHDPDLDEAVAYDPEAARQLLADAGYADGVSFDVYALQSGNMPEVVEVLQQQYAQVGVTMDIVPSPNYVQDFLINQPPGAGAIPVMGGGRTKVLQWSGDSVGNTCRYEDAELLQLIEELNEVSDSSDEAVELWHQIEAKVVEEALSVILLFGPDVAGYDSARVANPVYFPSPIVAPDLRETYVRR